MAVCNGGGDTIKVSQKKMEDVEKGSSSRKKRKRKEDEEIEAEFGLVVEELWGQVARRWEELEWQQEQRWATMMTTLEHITDDVWELLSTSRCPLHSCRNGQIPLESTGIRQNGTGIHQNETGFHWNSCIPAGIELDSTGITAFLQELS